MAYSDESPDGPQPIVWPRHEHAARPDRDRAGARVMLKLSRACDDSNAKIPFKSKAPRFFLMAIPAMFRFGSPAGMNLILYLNLYARLPPYTSLLVYTFSSLTEQSSPAELDISGLARAFEVTLDVCI